MARRHQPTHRSQLRVIAGKWRGSKIDIASNPTLRPTADRVRETLFNWLGGSISGARCLDLFAGSGALGIEALSRGAAHCTFVEADQHTAQVLKRQLDRLGAADSAAVMTADGTVLAPPPAPWDLVFVDPPFAAKLVPEIVAMLSTPGHLSADADIYVETARDDVSLDQTFPGFELWRDKQAGDVRYGLLRRL